MFVKVINPEYLINLRHHQMLPLAPSASISRNWAGMSGVFEELSKTPRMHEVNGLIDIIFLV